MQFQENARTDGRTEGPTDPTVRGPIKSHDTFDDVNEN